MIGIDTNILLRTIDRSNVAQSRAVDDLLVTAGGDPLFVNLVVLCEFAWTLERTYKRPRSEIAQRLAHVLEAPEFAVERSDLAERAVDLFEQGPANFSDYVIGEVNREARCRATLTFDRAALKSPALFQPLVG